MQSVDKSGSNPLYITNSELAQVQAYQTEMINIFRKQYQNIKEKEDFYTEIHAVTRFSIARQFKKEKVIEMWRNWIKWYQQYRPDQISEDQEIIHKIHTSGKYRFCGLDKAGCPVLVIRMKYHVKGLADADQNLRYLLYMTQKGVKMAKQAKTYQMSIIYDRRQMGESDQVSKKSMQKFMPILNDYYPETLKSFYVLGASFFYKAAWKVVSIFISKRTQAKVNLLDSVQNLQYFITPENLAQQFGGKLKIEDVGKIGVEK